MLSILRGQKVFPIYFLVNLITNFYGKQLFSSKQKKFIDKQYFGTSLQTEEQNW